MYTYNVYTYYIYIYTWFYKGTIYVPTLKPCFFPRLGPCGSVLEGPRRLGDPLALQRPQGRRRAGRQDGIAVRRGGVAGEGSAGARTGLEHENNPFDGQGSFDRRIEIVNPPFVDADWTRRLQWTMGVRPPIWHLHGKKVLAECPYFWQNSCNATVTRQVARNISWHHRAEVEVGPPLVGAKVMQDL